MANDIFSGNWEELSGEFKKQWSKLTDDDLGKIEGKKDELLGVLQEKYGWAAKDAKKKVEEFMDEKGIDLMDLKERATQAIQDLPKQLEDCVQESPMKSLLIAAGIGFLLGALFLNK
ncbi:MAG TPA: CsbD family protein [Gammaproteobacteria bacterium]|nr:CsbD family protein [Gammaproteobacteria bacterium]